MRVFVVLTFCFALFFAACAEDNDIVGEDHGNIAAGEMGLVLTQEEHEIGWEKSTCFDCHNIENIHQTDRTGTGLNLTAIRDITRDEGLSSCPDCHGTNGVE